MDEFCFQKGVEHALDHIGYSLNFVASGIAHWLHDGWGHSYPAGHRYHRLSGPTYSGTKNIIRMTANTVDREGLQMKRVKNPRHRAGLTLP